MISIMESDLPQVSLFSLSKANLAAASDWLWAIKRSSCFPESACQDFSSHSAAPKCGK